MRRPTLLEKRFGPGIRPGPVVRLVATWGLGRCGYECGDPPAGSVELWTDDPIPATDAYTRLLARLPNRAWVRVAFCLGHLEDVLRRSEQFATEPDRWAPGRESPPVLPRAVTIGGR